MLAKAVRAAARHAVGAAGGILVGKGLFDPATAQAAPEVIGGGVIAGAAYAWSVIEKRLGL